MTSSSVEAIPDGRECSFFASGRCKRASKCKFRHVERDSEGEFKKEWPTQWQKHVIATMDPEEMSRTWVSRTSLGQLMPMFVETHGAPGRILQSRRAGQRTHFTLNTSVPNSIVQSLASSTSLSSQQVYLSHSSDGTERPDPLNHDYIKLTNMGGIPDTLYHCTSLWAALGAIVTGHLVASNDSRPRAVFFLPLLMITGITMKEQYLERKSMAYTLANRSLLCSITVSSPWALLSIMTDPRTIGCATLLATSS